MSCYFLQRVRGSPRCAETEKSSRVLSLCQITPPAEREPSRVAAPPAAAAALKLPTPSLKKTFSLQVAHHVHVWMSERNVDLCSPKARMKSSNIWFLFTPQRSSVGCQRRAQKPGNVHISKAEISVLAWLCFPTTCLFRKKEWNLFILLSVVEHFILFLLFCP